MGGTGRGFQVTLAAATDSLDAKTPEPGPEVERPKANRQRVWSTGTHYERGETAAQLPARGTLRRRNPMSATSTKQGWEGFERNKTSRG
jgi:hypothetical protein